MRQVYAQFQDRNFTLLGVSLDEERTRAKWVQAIADDQLPWPQVSDLRGCAGETTRHYGIQSIAQNFLLDPQGHIVARNLRGEELTARLAQLLK